MTTITLATAPRTDSKRWPACKVTWHELVAWLDLANPVDHKEAGGYVLGRLRGARRTKGSVESRSPVLVLDADSARPAFPDELDIIHGYTAWWHTTWSHGEKGCRYRVGVLASREMTPDEYERAAAALMRRLGADQFDPTSAQASRFMYRPATQNRAAYSFGIVDGEPVDVDELLAEYAADVPRTPVEAANTADPAAGVARAASAPESAPEGVVRRQVDRALRDLDDLAALPEAGRLDWPGEREGVGWDRGAYYIAQRLVEAANSGTEYTLDDAREDFMKHAPAADGTYDPEHKWASAVRAVGDRGVPYESAADVFKREDPGQGVVVASGQEVFPADRVSQLFPAADLGALVAADRPPRQWVVHGLLPAGASVALVAPAGVGKSLIALALSLAVARGDRHFAGLAIPRPRRVLYADLENTPDDIAERLEAMGVRREDDLSRMTYLSLPPFRAFDTEAGGAELVAVMDHYLIGPGDLVVIDSLQRVVDGPENDADTMRAFYRHTALPLKARGVTVLRLDNSGKDVSRGARGTSSKRDDVDVELLLAPGRDPDLLQLTTGKVRIPDVSAMEIERRTDADGRIHFTTASDPLRAQVNQCMAALAAEGVPADAGWRPSVEALKRAGHTFPRDIVRKAVQVRKSLGGSL